MKFSVRLFGFALFLASLLAGAPAAQAQVNVNVSVGPPAWGPPVPAGTQYYYIPEIDGYYDIYNGVYLVFRNGAWVALPTLNGYDPYAFHPVVLDYRGRQPWMYVRDHRTRYPRQVVVVRPAPAPRSNSRPRSDDGRGQPAHNGGSNGGRSSGGHGRR
jgi:uncharacterized membrane protein YgcG